MTEHGDNIFPHPTVPGRKKTPAASAGYAPFDDFWTASQLLRDAADMWDRNAERLVKASEECEESVKGILLDIAETDRKKAARARKLAGA